MKDWLLTTLVYHSYKKFGNDMFAITKVFNNFKQFKYIIETHQWSYYISHFYSLIPDTYDLNRGKIEYVRFYKCKICSAMIHFSIYKNRHVSFGTFTINDYDAIFGDFGILTCKQSIMIASLE